ncbi:MAK10-like protein [Tanacetum coccineum]
MGDANPICTLGDYSKPSHEGYRNTIELPEWNSVVPLQFDTIRLVQNGCPFHGLCSEDPNQHLKDFLKLVDSLNLDGENRERTRLRLFQVSLLDQASNWLECLPAGSITTWEDLTTHFLAQFFPPKRTIKLRNDILIFQQHQGESLSEAFTHFKDLLQKVLHHGIDLWLQVQIFYDHVNPVTRRTIDQSADGKLYDRNAEESWALLEVLALYENVSWNDLRVFAKLVKAISLPHDVPSTFDRHLINLENQVQRLMEAHLAPMQPTKVNKITSSCEICSGPYDTQYCMENPKQAFVEYASSRTDEAGDVEVHIGKLKLLNDIYVIDMKKDLETPLLVGRGFLVTANGVIDYRKAKIAVGEGITRKDFLDCHFPREWEIARDAEINPFKDVLVFRRMVEFLGALLLNLKGNMWESEDLIENLINWDKPPKDGYGAWHAKIRILIWMEKNSPKPYNQSPPLESSSKEKVQRRSSTWTTSMTLDL